LLTTVVLAVAGGLFWTAMTRLDPGALDAAAGKAAGQRMLNP